MTVYFISKKMIEAHNKLVENGLDYNEFGINQFTDGTPAPKGRKLTPTQPNREQINQTDGIYVPVSSDDLSEWETFKVRSQ